MLDEKEREAKLAEAMAQQVEADEVHRQVAANADNPEALIPLFKRLDELFGSNITEVNGVERPDFPSQVNLSNDPRPKKAYGYWRYHWRNHPITVPEWEELTYDDQLAWCKVIEGMDEDACLRVGTLSKGEEQLIQIGKVLAERWQEAPIIGRNMLLLIGRLARGLYI